MAITYVIDPLNRLIGKKVNGSLVQGLLYKDHLNPIAELDGSGNVVAHFHYGSKPNVPDYLVKGDTAYFIVSDHLGSVRLVVNAVTGSVAQQLDYDEFGRVTVNTNSGFQPFGYASGIYDEHTELVRFGARDYDAEVGRWTSKDPIKFKGGINIYVYSENNPINRIDPSGRISLLIPVGAAVIIGGVIYIIVKGTDACFERCMKEKSISENTECPATIDGESFAEVSKNESRKDCVSQCAEPAGRAGSLINTGASGLIPAVIDFGEQIWEEYFAPSSSE